MHFWAGIGFCYIFAWLDCVRCALGGKYAYIVHTLFNYRKSSEAILGSAQLSLQISHSKPGLIFKRQQLLRLFEL